MTGIRFLMGFTSVTAVCGLLIVLIKVARVIIVEKLLDDILNRKD